jgi:hypothetical protein
MNETPLPPINQQTVRDNPAIGDLLRRLKGGAGNFFWIAAVSAAYSVSYFLGVRFSVVIGLGITQFMDIIALDLAHLFPNSGVLIRSLGLLLNFSLAGLFVMFGILAIKGHRWALITGMILYGLDAILTLVEGDVIGFVFHLFFLWYLFTGLQALDKLKILVLQSKSTSAFPKEIGH